MANLSVVINFKEERTILVYHEERNYKLADLGKASWVYLTSVGAKFDQLHEQVISYVKKTGAKLVFAPGSYQRRAGKERLREVISLSEVMIVNKREAQELLKRETGEVKELLGGLRELGTKVAVITDGERGSWSDDGEQVKFVGVFPETEVVERTGAGDAYAAGLVGGLVLKQDLGEAMRWGSVNAASVIEYIGSRQGLLTREKLEERLARWPKS